MCSSLICFATWSLRTMSVTGTPFLASTQAIAVPKLPPPSTATRREEQGTPPGQRHSVSLDAGLARSTGRLPRGGMRCVAHAAGGWQRAAATLSCCCQALGSGAEAICGRVGGSSRAPRIALLPSGSSSSRTISGSLGPRRLSRIPPATSRALSLAF